MPEVPDTVDDAIEPLSSPSTDEVFEATRPFSAREIASSAVARGGGGSSVVLSHTATLNDAEIKALPSAGILGHELLAPIPAKVPMLLQAVLRTSGFKANPYGNIDPDGLLSVRMGSPDSGVGGIGVATDIFNSSGSPPGAGLTQFLDQSLNFSDDDANVWPLLPSFVYNNDWGGAEPQPQGTRQAGTGGGFYIGINSALDPADLTGGDPANGLEVTLIYFLIDLS